MIKTPIETATLEQLKELARTFGCTKIDEQDLQENVSLYTILIQNSQITKIDTVETMNKLVEKKSILVNGTAIRSVATPLTMKNVLHKTYIIVQIRHIPTIDVWITFVLEVIPMRAIVLVSNHRRLHNLLPVADKLLGIDRMAELIGETHSIHGAFSTLQKTYIKELKFYNELGEERSAEHVEKMTGVFFLVFCAPSHAAKIKPVLLEFIITRSALLAKTEEEIVEMVGEMPCWQISKEDLFEGGWSNLLDILIGNAHYSGIDGNGSFRKSLHNKCIAVNAEIISDSERKLTEQDFLHGRFILLQNGKKHFFWLEII